MSEQTSETRPSIHLYVDDLRMPPAGYHLARSFDEAVTYFDTACIDELSLDFDMGMDISGGRERNGMDLVEYICTHRVPVQKIFLHSSSPYGRKMMYQVLISARENGVLNPTVIIMEKGSDHLFPLGKIGV